MILINENKYNEFKNVISGCRNFDDASYFSEKYLKHNEESKKIVYGVLNGKNYHDNISNKMFHEIMERVNMCEFQEECEKIINEFFPAKNTNDIKIKTLNRIMGGKKKMIDIKNIVQRLKNGDVIKYCPHCLDKYIGNDKTNYVICGYNNSQHGYNWCGCQKDWCFACGKKLCKSWDDNKLFLEQNRIHNSICCRNQAANNNENYLETYCQCSNKYVNRTLL